MLTDAGGSNESLSGPDASGRPATRDAAAVGEGDGLPVAILFPGQASQQVGMGASLCAASEAARRVFALADEVSGLPITEICATGPIEQLTQTEFTQVSLVTTCLAAAALLEEQLGQPPRAMATAGHSVGELTAMCWAGALSLRDALRLVAERGRLMARDSARVDGTMVAVLGLSGGELREICARASEQAGASVQVANLNTPDQVVLSGARSAIEVASALAQAAGANRVLSLNVGGPFHSKYMAEAGRDFAEQCAAVSFREPRCPIMLNTTAAPETKAEVLRDELGQQITSPVRWSETIQALGALGCSTFVELGPGRVLGNLARRTLPGAKTLAAGTPEAMGEVTSLWMAQK